MPRSVAVSTCTHRVGMPAARAARSATRPRSAEVVPAVGVKLGPGLDPAAVPEGWELEFVADRRDLKEAVAWSPALAGTTRRATVLKAAKRALKGKGGAGRRY